MGLHYPANAMLGRAVAQLCEELTATETMFPTTKLRLVYQRFGGQAGEGPPAKVVEASQERSKPIN